MMTTPPTPENTDDVSPTSRSRTLSTSRDAAQDCRVPEMTGVPVQLAPGACGDRCQAATSIEALNRTCYCLSLDEAALRRGLEEDLGARGLSSAMVGTHPHLFASVPMFVSRAHVEGMARVIGAVEAVVATPHFRDAALAWAPDIARFNPGSPGGLLGYDFHLAIAGPQLIEINTNPGGALLNAVLGRAHRSCCADAAGLALAPMEADAIEDALFEIFVTEWRLQRKDAPLKWVAIVDEAPEQQYLYPEFLLFRQLLDRNGIGVSSATRATSFGTRGDSGIESKQSTSFTTD